MKYLPLIWAGIWRKRGRAILMLLQIASAFLLFGLLQGLNSGIRQAIEKTHRDRIYITSSVGMGDPLPISMLERLRSTQGVRAVTPRSNFVGTYQRPDQFVPAVAVDVAAFFEVHGEVRASPQQIEALRTTRTGAIVGVVTTQKYGWKVGDRVVLQSALPKADGSRSWAFDIVGTYNMPDQPTNAILLIVNFDYLNEARMTYRDRTDLFVGVVDDAAHVPAIASAIDNAFANSEHETRTQSEGDLIATQLQRIVDLDFIVRGIIAAVFFALLLATGALLMQSVRERAPELAVLKTLGYTDRLVMSLILAEAVTFCLFSAGIGLALASLLLPMAQRQIGITSMPWVVIAAGAAFAVILALVGGSVPAWRGLRLQVADALADR